jgi:hypothetical protein
MHDAHLVAHSIPKRGCPLVDRQVRIINIRKAYDVRAKMKVQECLLGLSGGYLASAMREGNIEEFVKVAPDHRVGV